MTTTESGIVLLRDLINQDLRLEPEEKLPSENYLMEELEARLTQLISYLLDKDFNRLINAMYRIDISEEKFKAALNAPNPEDVAPTIARLIIQRELQKIEIRKKYSS